MKTEEKVIEVFRNNPHAVTNNDICWADICLREADTFFTDVEMETIERFLYKIIKRDITPQHSVVASISNVRTKHPEWKLTDEQLEGKAEAKQEWINRTNEYVYND